MLSIYSKIDLVKDQLRQREEYRKIAERLADTELTRLFVNELRLLSEDELLGLLAELEKL
jgi:hypothetical protein